MRFDDVDLSAVIIVVVLFQVTNFSVQFRFLNIIEKSLNIGYWLSYNCGAERSAVTLDIGHRLGSMHAKLQAQQPKSDKW